MQIKAPIIATIVSLRSKIPTCTESKSRKEDNAGQCNQKIQRLITLSEFFEAYVQIGTLIIDTYGLIACMQC